MWNNRSVWLADARRRSGAGGRSSKPRSPAGVPADRPGFPRRRGGGEASLWRTRLRAVVIVFSVALGHGTPHVAVRAGIVGIVPLSRLAFRIHGFAEAEELTRAAVARKRALGNQSMPLNLRFSDRRKRPRDPFSAWTPEERERKLRRSSHILLGVLGLLIGFVATLFWNGRL
jgi:hypothetical protein